MIKNLFVLMLISSISYASFPVVSENVVIEEGSNFINKTNIDPLNNLGWIALSCLALGGLLIALQPILDPNAFVGVYILLGLVVGFVAAILGLIWLFSRFKWGRKYWWLILLSLLLIQIILEMQSDPWN